MSSEYSGNFPCSLFNCPGCSNSLVPGQNVIGFPFTLTEKLGQGGFACVFRGKFHQGEAAFKFIPIEEQKEVYNHYAVGCHEYDEQIRAHAELKSLVDKPYGYLFVKIVCFPFNNCL